MSWVIQKMLLSPPNHWLYVCCDTSSLYTGMVRQPRTAELEGEVNRLKVEISDYKYVKLGLFVMSLLVAQD